MSDRPAPRVLILGWDAADWQFIARRFEQGGMPNLRALMARGSHSPLASLEPKLSPLLWTTVATGVTADRHGILHFIEPDDSGPGLRLASSTTRRTLALWNILTRARLRTQVVAWYASHPAEPVEGVVVSNLFLEGFEHDTKTRGEMPAGAVSPPEWRETIAACRVHPAAIPPTLLESLVPEWRHIANDPRLAQLRSHLARCLSVHRAALAVSKDPAGWDCAMVFQDAIDSIGHHFMQFHPPRMEHVKEHDFQKFRRVMDGLHELHDQMLGELLQTVGADTTVLLLSDHGFHSGDKRPVTEGLEPDELAATEALWHRDHGILVMAGPGIRPHSTLQEPSLLDITPTALSLLGLPAGTDMDGRVLAEALDHSPPPPVPGWDHVAGHAGLHPPELRQDPFEARDAIRQLVDLGYLADLPEHEQARLDLVGRETRFNLAMVHISRGRHAAAAAILNDLTKEKPAEPRYALNLATTFLRDARPGQSIAALRAFLKHDPRHIDARQLLAAALIADNQHAAAAECLADGECPGWRDDTRASRLGDLHFLLGDHGQALALYAEALRREPADPVALVGRIRVSIARGEYEPAANLSLDALEAHARLAEAHHQLGVALAWLGILEGATQSFRTATALQPGRIESLAFLARLHRHQGDQAAAADAESAIESILTAQAADPVQRSFFLREGPAGAANWARHFARQSSTAPPSP